MELLTQLGLPVGVVAVLAIVLALTRGALRLVADRRRSLAHEEIRRKLDYLDSQLSDYYLPISTRLHLSKRLFEFFEGLRSTRPYENDTLGIQASDPKALRNIVVQRIYLPLNREIERLLIEKGHWRAENDLTDHAAIIRHLILWRSLEEALLDKSIENYDATDMLGFPSNEAEKFKAVCTLLVQNRDELRTRVLRFQGFPT